MKYLTGEELIANEHIKNNQDVRNVLLKNNIIPEILPRSEDVQKIKRKLKSENKKLSKVTKKLNTK